jgi:hypothetical protein
VTVARTAGPAVAVTAARTALPAEAAAGGG